MFKKIKSIAKMFICLLMAIVSFFITYKIYKPKSETSVKPKDEVSVDLISGNNLEVNAFEVQPTVSQSVEKIKPSTKIIYEYYHESDDSIKQIEMDAPYFLLDMTSKQLQNHFQNWEIRSFSSENVVLRTNIKNQNSNSYIIGIHDGYIAIFYEEEINGISLDKVTDIPVNSLPVEEQQKLERGIYIKGEESLNRYLEDYGS